jgi:phthalate 4,5-dioxygenase oxygenase subunit
MGPRDTMTPFRDFGSETLPEKHLYARKQHTTCNWLQAMEGNYDSAHISWLHQWNGVRDLPDDGSDKPGYPSNAMSWKIWLHDRAPRLEVQDTWYGFRYAAIRDTPNGHTNARISEFIFPYNTIVAANPYTTRQLLMVPIDDYNTWRYNYITQTDPNPNDYGSGNLFAMTPFSTPFMTGQTGIIPRLNVMENDYLIDREDQKSSTYSGINDFVSQDYMVTETMGPIYDRTQEHLGTTDKAVIRLRQLLLKAARGLADGAQPPALTGDFRSIRSAEKTLEPGEDWRVLGTDDDPMIQEAMMVQS